jgi:hypothetical protein
MQASPHPSALPVAQAPPAGHATAVPQLLRQHLPGDPAFQDKDDPRQRRAVGDGPRASAFSFGWLRWEKRRDDRPQPVAH